jgi:catechol 2,3-dioxygenase-like lactoylglutathione lyase family enzyme
MAATAPLEVGISVLDLEGMIAFYRDVLGLAFVNTHDMGPTAGMATALSAAGYEIARLQAPGGERVKLVRAKAPLPAPAGGGTASVGEGGILGRRGIVYLTFIIADLDGAIRHLAAHGAHLLTGATKVEPRPGVFLAFAEDPEGNVIELVEYADIEAYRPDLHGGACG